MKYLFMTLCVGAILMACGGDDEKPTPNTVTITCQPETLAAPIEGQRCPV